MKDILIISNNKKMLDLENQKGNDYAGSKVHCAGAKAQYGNIKVQYVDTSVRDVLKLAQEKMASESLSLLCNPLCGRSARPFPYVSLLLTGQAGVEAGLGDVGGEDNIAMWNDLMAFEMMDQKNKAVYEKYPEDILEDFAVLDKDLVESALARL